MGDAPKKVIQKVCRGCFLQCYNLSHSFLDRIVSKIKNHEVEVYQEDKASKLTESAGIMSENEWITFRKIAEKRGLELTPERLAMLKLPDSAASFTCYAWMEIYFDLIGDRIPNQAHEMHIEPTEKEAIHEEYVEDMKVFFLN